MTSRFRIPDWLLLLAFCAFFFLWRLSSFGLIGADEPRYAQVAREMLTRHDWVTPTLGGSAWLEKPPLYYWQAIIAYKLFGVSDWAARLPSVLDACLLVFALYWFVRRFRPGVELDGALMLAASAGIAGFARAASMDMPLAAAFALAMLAWYAWFESGTRGFLACFYVFLALALLAKGPVAPFLAAIILVAFAATQRSLQVVSRTLWLPGMAVFFAVGLPWYVLAQLRNPEFFRVFIFQHNLARFGTNMFHHPEPFWYYLPVSFLAWVPWSLFVAAALWWAFRGFRKHTTDSLNVFLLLWTALIIVFFSISQSKLPGYILPALPGGTLLLANFLRERNAACPPPILCVLHAAIAGSLVFAALISPNAIAQRHMVWKAEAVSALLVAILIAAAVAVALKRTGYPGLRLVSVVPAVIALGMTLRLSAGTLDNTLSARSISQVLAQVAPRQLPVAVVLVSRETEFGLQFYWNQAIPRYELGQAPAGEHLVVARQGFQKKFERNVSGRKVLYLGNFPPQQVEFFYVSSR